MPYTEATICNMALGHVGIQGHITSLASDNSNEGIACNLFYEHARDLILEMMAWPCATVRVNLQLTGTPWDGWTYSYQYPTDCAFFEKIPVPSLRTENPDQKIPFKVIKNPTAPGKLILTDQENAVGQYNQKITDPAEFDATLAHAISLLLGTLIVTPLRVKADVAANVVKLYQAWQAEASGKALREGREDPMPNSEFMSVRA